MTAPRPAAHPRAPPMQAPPTGFPLPDPWVPLQVFPPMILYDAYAYVNMTNAHGTEMV
jgi:hypothetical protein